MKQWKKRQKQNNGDAMILAVCILAVVTVLCLSLLLISGVALSNAEKKLAKEQARILAVSYSEELEEQITKTYDSVNASPADGIWRYLRTNIDNASQSWPYYDEDTTGHGKADSFRTYKVDLDSNTNTIDSWYTGVLGNLELTMYWTKENTAGEDTIYLYTVVTAERNGAGSTVTTCYSLAVIPGGSEEKWQWQKI